MVCPHAAIRIKAYDEDRGKDAPATFKARAATDKAWGGMSYTIQVAPEDCTGCNLCVNVCPGKDKTNPKHKAINMRPADEHGPVERPNFQVDLEQQAWYIVQAHALAFGRPSSEDIVRLPHDDTVGLLVRVPGRDPLARPLLFSGHMDVVDARPEAQFTGSVRVEMMFVPTDTTRAGAPGTWTPRMRPAGACPWLTPPPAIGLP
mgnify:CR=1 FL=1